MPSKRPRIVGAGLIALDIVISASAVREPRFMAGGTCGNVLTILAAFGWRSVPVGRLRDDGAGRHVAQDFETFGVDTQCLSLEPTTPTPIIVERIATSGDGTPVHKFSFTCPNCGRWLPGYRPVPAAGIGQATTHAPSAEVFFLDRLSRSTLDLADHYRSGGAVVMFEPSSASDPRMLGHALELCHILKYSRDRMNDLSQSAKRRHVPLEIETLGAGGLRYRWHGHRNHEWRHLAAFAVGTARDTAGAGDFCSAAVLDCLARGGGDDFLARSTAAVAHALAYGQAVAAWSCQYEGPRGAMYDTNAADMRVTVDRLMRKRTASPPYREWFAEADSIPGCEYCSGCADKDAQGPPVTTIARLNRQ
jgi:fructokinase